MLFMLSNDDPKDPKETRRKGFLGKKTGTLKVSTGAVTGNLIFLDLSHKSQVMNFHEIF